jgi:fructosamine-3-kinase
MLEGGSRRTIGLDSQLGSLLDPSSVAAASRRCVLAVGRAVFVKRRADVPDDFFTAEARGLDALRRSQTLRVPQVFAVARSGIVLEDLGTGRASAAAWENGGRALARLHTVAGPARFGFEADGYCGDSALDNTWEDDGFDFFAARRLLPQARRAGDAGLLAAADVRGVEALATRLPQLLPAAAAVLIHGDLWTGNLHACADGELALIDAAAVHRGWAECDLAMLTLFGEPPPEFFAAYEAETRIGSAWRKRAPLLNLYHLLNHLNLFGTGYIGAVRSVLRAYA